MAVSIHLVKHPPAQAWCGVWTTAATRAAKREDVTCEDCLHRIDVERSAMGLAE